MNVIRTLAIAVLVTGLAGCTAAVPVAQPTATETTATEAPVSAVDLAAGTQDEGVDVEVAGPTQVAFKEITLAPGAGTGLHCHYGQLIAVVESGELTHYAPIYPTGVHVYEAGDSLVEGAHYVHQGVNEGTVDLVLAVTYVIPAGEPLAETNLDNCDPQ
jgi:quercetin dioxygenase-like cupin family protein